MAKFNEEGITKLVDAVDGDIVSLLDRAKAVAEASKDYRTFSCLADDMTGEVRFIYSIID